MKVRYIGDPSAADRKMEPDSIEAHGVAFERDKWVSVPDDHASADKFRNNSHFEVQGQKATAPAAPAGGAEALMPSTTGDPETASRETLENLGAQDPPEGHDAHEPMRAPRGAKS